jgi:hypothetical protein
MRSTTIDTRIHVQTNGTTVDTGTARKGRGKDVPSSWPPSEPELNGGSHAPVD